MMKCFCSVDTAWQSGLIVLSILTGMMLTGGCVFSFRHRHNLRNQLGLLTVLLLNAAFYVGMQVQSRMPETEYSFHVPYVLPVVITLLFAAYAVRLILRETRNRKTINHSSIMESFDNLPTGVCFFNEAGLPVLCNLAMHRFSFAVCGKDVQFIADLEDCLAEEFVPVGKVRKDGKIFILPTGRAYQLEKKMVPYENGFFYTQLIATDVTELQRSRMELTEENAQLLKVQSDLKRLSANVVAITREEEILNTKMRVHDEMGRCLIASQEYLKDYPMRPIPREIAASWQRAVSMLKYNNDSSEENMLLEIQKTCAFVKLDFVMTGELPANERTAYLLTCAVRECVTNAVRYARATALYVDFTEDADYASVTITNNGKVPEGEIQEGGGLTTLRRRIERAGGRMILQSQPAFRLSVTIPKGMEGAI